MSSPLNFDFDPLYPESDGKPMADSTLQFDWISIIKWGLDKELKNDFVAGDLFWYPVKGDPYTRVAPDVLVALGRPKGPRRSYKQWEEDNIAPQVVFEILSYTNTKEEMAEKLLFYQRHGVSEYYVYDPQHNNLKGWLRAGDKLLAIAPIQNWTSPLLGIHFELTNKDLTIYHPNGERFLDPIEMSEQQQQATKHAQIAEEKLVQEQKRVKKEHQRAEKEHQRAEKEHQRAEKLAAKLRELGIDPSQI